MLTFTIAQAQGMTEPRQSFPAKYYGEHLVPVQTVLSFPRGPLCLCRQQSNDKAYAQWPNAQHEIWL